MIDKLGTTGALEEAYDLIAEGIDRAGEAKATLFLAKLSLALAYLAGDSAKITQAVDAALRDL
jgi:ethanolamine utilization microcompartment shell protein EutL